MTSASGWPCCPACGLRWAPAQPLRRYPLYGRCDCGLVGRIGEVTEDYGDDYFDTENPAEGHRDFTSAWAQEYDRRRFAAELDRVGPPFGNQRLLDVGAATGGYLSVARERGWDVAGVEPAPGARRLAARRGIELVAGLGDLPADACFDLITLHHVLEHLSDPVDVLLGLRGLLSATGRVLIEVPNWRSNERMASGEDWVDLRPEQHRWQFAPSTLTATLRRAGYETLDLETLGDPMPSPGTVLLSLGVPLRALRVVRPAASSEGAPGIRAEDSLVTTAARLVDVPVDVLKLGKRLLAIAAPQRSERSRADALSITAP